MRKEGLVNAVVVYDTEFGNTEQIARAIAATLSPTFSVRLEKAGEIQALNTEHINLLILGGPTQRQRMTGDLRAVLEAFPRRSLKGLKAAAFDTRYRMAAGLSGSAAQRAARKLKKAGAELIAPPESFFIERDVPPEGEKRRHELERLEAGEVERAGEWASKLAEAAGLG
jgi:flavodoxin